MFNNIVSKTRPHFATIAELSVRDTELMAGSVLLLCGLTWYIGHPVVAISVLLTIASSEIGLRLMFRRKWVFSSFSHTDMLTAAMVFHLVNVILYALPAVYLAGEPSFAIKLSGLIFAMGIQVYIANTWSGIPVFNFLMILPVMAMTAVVFMVMNTSAPKPSTSTEWGISVCILTLFFYSGIDTLSQQLSRQMALFTAQKDASTRLSQLEEAHRHDALTGLLNRPAFDVALSVMLQEHDAADGEIGVFLVDLDSFKPINDTYSHEAGDEVLKQTAHRLRDNVCEMGIVGRLGGDEFIVALHGLRDTREARSVAEDFSGAINEFIHWKDRTLRVSASIGIAMTGLGDASPRATVSGLCSAADQAMFAAKSATNRGPVLYQTDAFAPRMSAEDKQCLIEAITNGAITPYYQPKIHLPTGQIIGFEALARWEHPDGITRNPSDFLEQINDLGLQGDFLMTMAHQVTRDIMKMRDAGLDPGQVSLNVPEVALATHTGCQDLHRVIGQFPEVADYLTFEITEDVFIARAADAIQASIATFRALGVRISLDDFGTGFASFHHLRQLDFDELKIDTSFVAGLGHDTTSEVLVRGFLSIASGLGVSVIAEGVETDAQSRDLVNMGCLSAQGHLFSAAVPIASAMDLLADQQAA